MIIVDTEQYLWIVLLHYTKKNFEHFELISHERISKCKCTGCLPISEKSMLAFQYPNRIVEITLGVSAKKYYYNYFEMIE